MTIVTAEKTWTWSPDVLQFARQSGVDSYLDPLLEATRDLFPQADELRIYAAHDPEIANDQHLVWELPLPVASAAEYLTAQKQWIGELCRVCPAPLTCVFRLTLMPVRNGSA